MRSTVVRHFRNRPQFQALLRRRPVARTRHFALHHLSLAAGETAPDGGSQLLFSDHDGPWLAAMVPKRWARRAVRRNLIRRQIHALGEQALAGRRGAWLLRLRAPWDTVLYPSASSTALRRAVRAELLELLAQHRP